VARSTRDLLDTLHIIAGAGAAFNRWPTHGLTPPRCTGGWCSRSGRSCRVWARVDQGPHQRAANGLL